MTSINGVILRSAACVLMLLGAVCGRTLGEPAPAQSGNALRVATYNIEDVRSAELADTASGKLKHIAAIVQTIRPDILFINEIQADEIDGRFVGANAARFAELYLGRSQGEGLEPIEYDSFMAPSNTGVHSLHDLDNDGVVNTTPGERAYGNDCLGYGAFPGQYGMALFVRRGLRIERDQVRTFRTLLWKHMPDAKLPPAKAGDDSAAGWYTAEELAVLPLSSKSHWDVPVRLDDGQVVHVLCSHPTPPVFDGPEDRNGRRNHDEIRFWADYLNGDPYIVDDAGTPGGLAPEASFVIVGDLNADPERGDSLGNPIRTFLLNHPRISSAPAPRSEVEFGRLGPVQTAKFGLRVDYVLPSKGLDVVAAGVYRGPQDAPEGRNAVAPDLLEHPSDHFLVWIDVRVAE